jgi:steroid delta-isomerase-like uncharacterized protein
VSADDLKARYREYMDVIWSQRNLDALHHYFTEDMLDYAAPPGQAPGLEGLRATMSMFFEAFPDWQTTIEDVIVEGDKLVARIAYTATHRGVFFGIPATGRRIDSGGTHIFRFEGGKMAEHWSHSDDLRMMQQLGVIQMMGQ